MMLMAGKKGDSCSGQERPADIRSELRPADLAIRAPPMAPSDLVPL
jgi:hypothetical protein